MNSKMEDVPRSHKLLGYFKTRTAHLIRDNDNFILLFLEDRILAARVKGEFWDPKNIEEPSSKAIILFGYIDIKLAPRVPYFKKKINKAGERVENRVKRILELKSIDDVLEMDKKNLQIFYKDATGVTLNKVKTKNMRGRLIISGKKKIKFIIPNSEDLFQIKKLLKSLFKERLTYKESLF